MCRKIRCDGKSQKIYKFFWELNKALVFDFVKIIILDAYSTTSNSYHL